MSKTTKAFMAFLTAMTMTAGAMSVTAYAKENNTAVVTESIQTDGKFSLGAEYHFIKGADGLVIDGKGWFTPEEFDAVVKQFSPRAIAFGDKVTPPADEKTAKWIVNKLNFLNPYVVYCNIGSNFFNEQSKMLTEYSEKLGVSKVVLGNILGEFESTHPNLISDYISMFTYDKAVLDKESEVEQYLKDKGINDVVARKLTGCYLNGLNMRVRNYYEDPETVNKANPDGTETLESTKEHAMSGLFRAAKQLQQVMSNQDPSEYTDELSQLINKDGKFKNTRTSTLSNSSATAYCLALSLSVYYPEGGFKHYYDDTQNNLPVVQPSAVKASENTTERNIEAEDRLIASLKGDADVNGEVGLSDVIVLSKYNLSNSSYPLANDTAFANADMNSDGKVDGLDTSALIEKQLGKK